MVGFVRQNRNHREIEFGHRSESVTNVNADVLISAARQSQPDGCTGGSGQERVLARVSPPTFVARKERMLNEKTDLNEL